MGALTAPRSRLCFSVICHWRMVGQVPGSVVARSVRPSAVDLRAVLLAFWLQFGCALAEFSVQSCKVEPYTWVPGIFFFWPVVFVVVFQSATNPGWNSNFPLGCKGKSCCFFRIKSKNLCSKMFLCKKAELSWFMLVALHATGQNWLRTVKKSNAFAIPPLASWTT